MNGCGADKSWFKPPYAIFFEASCNKHDLGYEQGGNEQRRLHCDIMFYKFMIIDTWRINNKYKRLYYQLWASLYFLGVRLKGYKYFNYGG